MQGAIVDMLGDLVVSASIVKVETGEIVGKAAAQGAASDYKRIVRELGLAVAKAAGAEAKALAKLQAPVATPAPAARQAEVLSSISTAVDAIDRKDLKAAEKSLAVAKKIDPNDETVRALLDRLNPGSSKFSLIPDPYFSLDNPASLGFSPGESIYLKTAAGLTEPFAREWGGYLYPMIPTVGTYGEHDTRPVWNPALSATEDVSYESAARYGIREIDARAFTGVTFPLGASSGAGVQCYYAHQEWNLLREGVHPDRTYSESLDLFGGALVFGWAPSRLFALGASVGMGSTDPSMIKFSDTAEEANGLTDGQYPPISFYSGEFGFLLRNGPSTIVYSFVGGYSSYSAYVIDLNDMGTKDTLGVGWIHFDHSMTWGLNGMKDFLVFRHISGQYGFESAPTMQLVPAWEHWFGNSLSLRLAGIWTFSLEGTGNGYFNPGGLGATFGATIIAGAWEFDLSGTVRYRNSYAIYKETIPELAFSLGVKETGLIYRRK